MRDADVRRAVKAHLQLLHEDDATTRIVEEMGVWSGAVRVDIAVINGELCGYELKSDSDNLARLPNQVEIYGKVFDRMTLVVGGKHYDKALSCIPSWWGCVLATMKNGGIKLATKRRAKRNPNPDPAILAQLIWKDEAVSILEKHGLAKGWRAKSSADVARHLIDAFSYRQLALEVREVLKNRPKLGQLSPGNLEMPIDAITDPAGRTSGGGGRIGDSIDHLIPPAICQWGSVW
ncbi:sce7726 family protein [Mesorhizobium sp. B2-5-4]|nr:sce7726 family protein [Mesorhizobium sp. B2-5-4]